MDRLFEILNWIRAGLKAADLMPGFSSATAVFCLVAWAATFLAAGMVVVSLFTGGGDGDVDFDGDAGSFSVRAIVGLLLGFGWGGYMAVQSGVSVWGSVLIGLGLGAVMFLTVAGMVRFIYSLKSDGSRDFDSKSMVGMTGVVYVTIPPAGELGGQVQVSREGSQLITMPAVQEGDSPIPSQTSIEVVAATPYQLTVRPMGAKTRA